MEPATQSGPLSDALAFLYGRINYERANQIPPGSGGLQLDRMRALLERLGNPHTKMPIVHLAGTKGKGSTAAFVAGILQAAGHRTGLYASPHLERLEERFRVDGQPCSGEQLTELVEEIRPAVAALDAQASSPKSGPTFFEITTALGMLHFAREEVDYAVLEVGMGGRLDSTNVCLPRVSVITSISFDHTLQLGNTLAKIATEKAGIIKPGIDVVSGVDRDEPRQVIRRTAAERKCRLFELGREFHVQYHQPVDLAQTGRLGGMDFSDETIQIRDISLRMLGSHQAANAALAAAAVQRLGDDAITPAVIRSGLQHVVVPARIEVIGRQPLVILDTAHNVASVRAMVATLAPVPVPGKRILLFAATRDKDIHGMLQVLLPCFDEVVLTRYLENPRSVPPESYAERVREELANGEFPAHVSIAATPREGWERCRERATAADLICITGSFFLAAELRKELVPGESTTPSLARAGKHDSPSRD